MTRIDESDEQLIQRLRNGEAELMDYLLEKYKPLVRKRANALYLIGGDTEDLIQEGMIGLFKAIRDYMPDKSTTFATFAQLCVTRQLYSALESSNRKKNQPLNAYVSFSGQEGEESLGFENALGGKEYDPERMILEQEKIREFFEEIAKNLSTMEQRVLTLYLEGNNYRQIAELMEKPPKSIDNALQRIRAKIRMILDRQL